MNLTPLITLLRQEAAAEIPAQARALYDNFCSTLLRPEAALAGLFYGSALWKNPTADSVWDIYVLIDAYDAVKGNIALRLAGSLLPPNVYYHEMWDGAGNMLRGKIAVMTLAQFSAHASGKTISPQTWARFAQPCRIITARDEAARDNVLHALAHCVASIHRATAPLVEGRCSIAQFWQSGLTHTYASEFRSERHGRQSELVEASQALLKARSIALLSHYSISGLRMDGAELVSTMRPHQKILQRFLQQCRNIISKVQHVLRLMKAAFTFVGGLDYLVYKIERHSGVRLQPSAFARRHPLLGVWPLFIQALRARAIR